MIVDLLIWMWFDVYYGCLLFDCLRVCVWFGCLLGGCIAYCGLACLWCCVSLVWVVA